MQESSDIPKSEPAPIASGAEVQLYVNMLGEFSITQATPSCAQSAELSINCFDIPQRIWLILAYLVVNRKRGVSSQELLDFLQCEMPGEKEPVNLDNQIRSAITLFSEAGFFEPEALITYSGGFYCWAPNASTVLDAEVFEENARNFTKPIPSYETQRINRALDVCNLFTGEFLNAKAGFSWCDNWAIYYRTIYKRLSKIVISALLEAHRLKEAQELCLKVTHLDPVVEEFSVLLMRAYIEDGDAPAALDHYEVISSYLLETYDIHPGTQLEASRELALQALYGQSMTEDKIKNFLYIPTEEEGAFACTNAVFREIVLLRIRERQRTKMESHVISITAEPYDETRDLSEEESMEVSSVISAALRASDPYTKIGNDQFLILLTGADEESARKVFNRIAKRFNEAHPHAEVDLQLSLVNLEALC